MKDMIAKLKSKGFKQIAIDHGEWLVAGVLGLSLLMALWFTNWKRYDGTPEELSQKVQSSKQQIATNKWQDSPDAENFTPAAGLKEDEVHQLLAADEATHSNLVEKELQKYQISAPLFQSVYRRQEPARQPDALPVVELTATPSRALIAKASAYQEQDQLADAAAEDGSKDDNDGGRRFKGQNAGAPGTGGAFGPGGPARPFAGPTPTGAAGPGGMGGIPGAQAGGEADGMAFNAIVGIVPLFRQTQRFEDALSLSNKQAAPLVSYWDFHLERRSKPSSQEAHDWSGWTRVDIKTAEEVLSDAAGWDAELVDIALTDPVLTMSLPTRLIYEWSEKEASHPKVNDYVLPPAARERQMQLYESYLDQQLEAYGMEREQTKRGLSALQNGNRNFMQTMAGPVGGRARTSAGLIDEMAKKLDGNNADQVKREIMDQWLKRETAAGRLLLFRYFDFDVKPGATYQYRVQLVLTNPNYQRGQQFVIDPEITKERFLTTPFSDPTPAVTVPPNIKYFVTRVDEESGSNPPSATFDVFQWSTEFGTTINDRLKVYFGGFVADRREEDVIDPAGQTFREKQEVDFSSDDVLVDVFNAPGSIDVGQHPDLKDLSREKLTKGLGVSEQALLVNEFGDLVAVDSLSTTDSREKAEKDYKAEQTGLDYIKESGAGRAGAMGGGDMKAYETQFGPGAGGLAIPGVADPGGRGRGRGGKALRRGRGRNSAAPGGRGPGGR